MTTSELQRPSIAAPPVENLVTDEMPARFDARAPRYDRSNEVFTLRLRRG